MRVTRSIDTHVIWDNPPFNFVFLTCGRAMSYMSFICVSHGRCHSPYPRIRSTWRSLDVSTVACRCRVIQVMLLLFGEAHVRGRERQVESRGEAQATHSAAKNKKWMLEVLRGKGSGDGAGEERRIWGNAGAHLRSTLRLGQNLCCDFNLAHGCTAAEPRMTCSYSGISRLASLGDTSGGCSVSHHGMQH